MPRLLLAGLAVLAVLACLPAEAGELEPWSWDDVPRVVAIGDLHGALSKLETLLRAAGLIDETGSWRGGRDHLVICGDFLDRGPYGRRIMDRLRQLERESLAAGGRVHVLLGNHEVMNLVQDLRYVSRFGYLSFAAEERPARRAAAFERFRVANGRGDLTDEQLQAAFAQACPPGFFARRRAFQLHGKYGAWLLDKPAIVRINGVLYLHGGLTEDVAELGLAAINEKLRDDLLRHLEAREKLVGAGLMEPYLDFAEQRAAAERLLQLPQADAPPAALRRAAQTLLAYDTRLLLGPTGPLWYRGNALESERVERERVSAVLDALGARAMVIGHSPTRGDTILSRFLGTVYRIDVGMAYGSSPQALVESGGELRVLDSAVDGLMLAAVEDPFGQRFVPDLGELPDRQLETALSEAVVIDMRPLGRGSTRPVLLELMRHDQELRGLFKQASQPGAKDSHRNEIAAYRLDRRLGLRLVPVTVSRNLFGTRGSVQLWIEGAIDRRAIDEHGIQFTDIKEIRLQLDRARIFDALIDNPDRSPSDTLFLPAENRLMLVDHAGAFSVSGQPGWNGNEPPNTLDPLLRGALASLNQENLRELLGEWLSRKQLRALLARRDRILERYKR